MTIIHIDPRIPFADFAKAMADLGYELRTAPDGTLKVVKRRAPRAVHISDITGVKPLLSGSGETG